jgi:cytochrome P450
MIPGAMTSESTAGSRRQRAVELPGPRLPGPIQTFAFFWRPVQFVEAVRRRFGRNFRLQIAPFGEIAYVSDPEVVREVFTGGTDVFHAGEGNWMLRPILGERSVLVLDEEDHLQQRRLLLPPFHGDAVRRYVDIVREAANNEVDGWPVGEPISLHARMQSITLEVIMRAVIGVRSPERRRALRHLLPRLLDIRAHDLLLFALWPSIFESAIGRRFGPLRVRGRVDRLLYEEIRERRVQAEQHGDVLSLLVAASDEDGRGLSDDELRDQLVTLLLAGHDTTATALAWAFERLARHPEALRRLQAEIASGDGDAYLDAVCKETLRIRPVVMDVVRKITRPVEVAGYRVAAGALVAPAIALSHLAPDTYAAPHAFRPERFLEEKPGTYTWFPFGGGPRRCIGASFALMEMKEVLRTVLARVEVAPLRAPPERAKVKHVTLVPAKGARVALAAKRARAVTGGGDGGRTSEPPVPEAPVGTEAP